MRRRRDPRVVVLVVAGFAVLSGVVVGMAARWPTAGVVVSFVLVSSAAVVVADDPALRNALRRAAGAVRGRLRDGEETGTEDADVSSAEARLRRAGVLTCDDGVPAIAPDFEREWRRRIVSMGDRSEDEAFLGDLLAAPREDVRLEWEAEEDVLVATVRGTRAGRWPSRAAFVADVTAVTTFRDEYPEWWTLSSTERTRALAALRLCLDWCPTCDGPIRIARADRSDDRRGDGTESVLAATCGGCAARLFEADLESGPRDRPRPRDAEA